MSEDKVKDKVKDSWFRLESDGTVEGTRVIDATGKVLGRIKKVVWEADADNEMPMLHLYLLHVPINATINKKNIKVTSVSTDNTFYNFAIQDRKTEKDVGEGTVFSSGKVCVVWSDGNLSSYSDPSEMKDLKKKFNIRRK